MNKGLIVLPSGERSIRFRPPLNVSSEEIEEGVEIIAEVLREL
jgi:4-aminobutyrate aminotransferase-like enzyme